METDTDTKIVAKILHDVQPKFLSDFRVDVTAATNLSSGDNPCLEPHEASELMVIPTERGRLMRLFEILRGKPSAISNLITYFDECQVSQSHLKNLLIQSRDKHMQAAKSIQTISGQVNPLKASTFQQEKPPANDNTSTTVSALTRLIGSDEVDEIFEIVVNNPVAYEYWQSIVVKLIKDPKNRSHLDKMLEEGRASKETIVLKTLQLFCGEQVEPCSIEKFLSKLQSDKRFAALIGEIKKKFLEQ